MHLFVYLSIYLSIYIYILYIYIYLLRDISGEICGTIWNISQNATEWLCLQTGCLVYLEPSLLVTTRTPKRDFCRICHIYEPFNPIPMGISSPQKRSELDSFILSYFTIREWYGLRRGMVWQVSGGHTFS